MEPENRFEAHGLRPGVLLHLEVSMDEQVATHVTLLEAIEEARLVVLTPMARLEFAPMPQGAVARASYSREGRRMRFVSEVLGTGHGGALQYLSLPALIELSERRRSYRLPVALEPIRLFQLVHTAAPESLPNLERISTVVDISEGGLCLSTRAGFRAGFRTGDRLAIHLELPDFGPVMARMAVVAVQPPEPGFLNARAHCAFEEIDRATQDRIARFVMHRQVELAGRLQG